MGYIGLPPVMMGIENGLEIKCVGCGHVEGTVMIGSLSYQTYDELGDVSSVLGQFECESIGTPTRGSIHDIIIQQLTQGLDIEVKNYNWADFIPEALEDGEIAAGMGTPSLATAATQQTHSQNMSLWQPTDTRVDEWPGTKSEIKYSSNDPINKRTVLNINRINIPNSTKLKGKTVPITIEYTVNYPVQMGLTEVLWGVQ